MSGETTRLLSGLVIVDYIDLEIIKLRDSPRTTVT